MVFSFLVMGLIGFSTSQAEAFEICGVEICDKKLSNEEKIATYMTSIEKGTNTVESMTALDKAMAESIKQKIDQKHKEIDDLSEQLFELTGEVDAMDPRSIVYQQTCSPPKPTGDGCFKISGGTVQRMDQEACTDE